MKKKLLAGLAIAVLVIGTVEITQATPIQFTDNGHWYEVVNTSTNWTTANSTAQNSIFNGINGHLATITTAKENDFILGLLGNSSWFIGGFQNPGTSEPLSDWQWVTGETWDYSNWNNNEPNNAGEEDYLEIHGQLSSYPEFYGKWNDLSNSDIRGYIAEYDTVPIPGPATIFLLGSGLIGLAGAKKKFKK